MKQYSGNFPIIFAKTSTIAVSSSSSSFSYSLRSPGLLSYSWSQQSFLTSLKVSLLRLPLQSSHIEFRQTRPLRHWWTKRLLRKRLLRFWIVPPSSENRYIMVERASIKTTACVIIKVRHKENPKRNNPQMTKCIAVKSHVLFLVLLFPLQFPEKM